MPRGVSIHLGIQSVNPARYDRWLDQLSGPPNDARDMQTIAQSKGFQPTTLLLNQSATSQALLDALADAAASLAPSDTLLLTFSGHGGQIPDRSNPGRQAQTWCLYDRMVVSHELAAAWPTFPPGVRVVVVSDSCYSGTIIRDFLDLLGALHGRLEAFGDGLGKAVDSVKKEYPNLGGTKFHLIPPEVALATYRMHQAMYDELCMTKNALGNMDGRMGREFGPGAEGASVILLAACQENQEAADGFPNSKFTEILKAVWADGGVQETYSQFLSRIASRMPPTQTPNYFTFGRADPSFAEGPPFTI